MQAFSQAPITVKSDTIFEGTKAFGILKKDGTGFTAHHIKGTLLIYIKENYYKFSNGMVAYPDVTVRSAEMVASVIINNLLFNSSGLNEKSVLDFSNKYSSPPPVLPFQRESREEIAPEIR